MHVLYMLQPPFHSLAFIIGAGTGGLRAEATRLVQEWTSHGAPAGTGTPPREMEISPPVRAYAWRQAAPRPHPSQVLRDRRWGTCALFGVEPPHLSKRYDFKQGASDGPGRQAVFLLSWQPLQSPSPRPVPWFGSRHLADSRSFSRAQHLAAGTPPSPRPWCWSVSTTALRDSPSVCAAPLGSTAIVHRAHSQWRPSVLCC